MPALLVGALPLSSAGETPWFDARGASAVQPPEPRGEFAAPAPLPQIPGEFGRLRFIQGMTPRESAEVLAAARAMMKDDFITRGVIRDYLRTPEPPPPGSSVGHWRAYFESNPLFGNLTVAPRYPEHAPEKLSEEQIIERRETAARLLGNAADDMRIKAFFVPSLDLLGVGSGPYNEWTDEEQRPGLLAHELTHIVLEKKGYLKRLERELRSLLGGKAFLAEEEKEALVESGVLFFNEKFAHLAEADARPGADRAKRILAQHTTMSGGEKDHMPFDIVYPGLTKFDVRILEYPRNDMKALRKAYEAAGERRELAMDIMRKAGDLFQSAVVPELGGFRTQGLHWFPAEDRDATYLTEIDALRSLTERMRKSTP